MALSSATSSLAQELAAARDEIAVKEASVKQHQKVAEDAIAGTLKPFLSFSECQHKIKANSYIYIYVCMYVCM